MNIIPLPIYGINNSSNQKLNNTCFNGSLDKSVYTFVEKSIKLELGALQEHANSVNIPIGQRRIDYITHKWDNALKILEAKVKKLHKNTTIKVYTEYSYRLGPLGGHYNCKKEILRASNPNCMENQDLSVLNQNELYTSELLFHPENCYFPNDNICEAKQFLRKINSVNFNNIDKKFYKMEKRWLLNSDYLITESVVNSIVNFGKEVGKKTSNLFLMRVKNHNEKITKNRQIKNNNNKIIQDSINGLSKYAENTVSST